MHAARQVAVLILSAACAGAATAAAPACTAVSGGRTLPLVELYTSEGCDSCPPADQWLRESFVSREGVVPRAAVLAFHVDYWDALGWPDRFASRTYTERQQALVRAGRGPTAYTPQLFVQGKDRGLWRDRSVADALDEAGRAPSRARLELASRSEGDSVIVDVRASVDAANTSDVLLRVALTESGLSSAVRAGENSGKRLVHGHVVRAFTAGPAFDASGKANGQVRIALPRERGRDATIVAFVERHSTSEILQSLTLPLCGG